MIPMLWVQGETCCFVVFGAAGAGGHGTFSPSDDIAEGWMKLLEVDSTTCLFLVVVVGGEANVKYRI